MTEHDEKSRLLDERLSKLPAEIPPGRDLWPEIAARIDAGRRRAHRPSRGASWWRPVLAAASVAVVAVLATNLRRGDESPQPETVPAGPASPVAATFGPGHELGGGYLAARAGLTDDLERRLEALPPETRETVLENLATIRRATAEINAALGEDPANVLLQHQLLAAYQDELSVLANLQRVTGRLPMRNEL
ncbi:MAG TPA: hypothetical protein VMQ83_10150 [Gammaproteobacteria bacterium]|nr:hypothetical protein [Gammaproteobacteria bacterium]